MVKFPEVSSICSHDAALVPCDGLNHGILAKVIYNCFISLYRLVRVEGTGCFAPGWVQ